jgi:hypothetical protein
MPPFFNPSNTRFDYNSFYHAEAGIKSFEKIITDLPGFQKSSREPIRHFQEAVAFPMSKKSFLQNMDTKITSANSEV